jgi:transposase
MPKAFPQEFREDVIRVYRDSDASLAQVAKDFGISPSCLKRWVTIDDRKSTRPSPAGRAANESDAAARSEHRSARACSSEFPRMGPALGHVEYGDSMFGRRKPWEPSAGIHRLPPWR